MNDAAMLTRAAAAYQRAGAADAAARCYEESGNHLAAARIYLDLRRHEKAASQYILGGRSEVAAWVYAHHLAQTDIARDIVADFDLRRTELRRVCERLAVANLSHMVPVTWPLLPADTDFDVVAANALAAIRQRSRQGLPIPAGLVDDIKAWVDTRQASAAEVTVPDLIRRLILARCDVTDRADHRDVLPVLTASQAALADPATSDPSTIEEWSVTIADQIHRYDQAALIFAAAVRSGLPDAAVRWREWAARVLGTELILPVSTDSR